MFFNAKRRRGEFILLGCHPEMLALKDLDSSAQALQNDNNVLRTDKALYSESTGRILVTIAPQNKAKFEKTFKNFEHVHLLGHVAYGDKLNIKGTLNIDINQLEKAYKQPLKNY